MGIRVAFGVPKIAILGDESVREVENVAHNVRVRPFVDGQAGRGVRGVDGHDGRFCICGQGAEPVRDIDHGLACGSSDGK